MPNIIDEMGEIGKSVYHFLGEEGFKLLSLSLLSTRTIPRQASDRLSKLVRFKIHPMFFWESGFFKTSIMHFFKEVTNTREDPFIHSSREVTTASFRGSVEDQNFVPPTLLKAPVIFFPEFSTVLASRESERILANIRSVLEDPIFSVELNRFVTLPPEAQEEAQNDYGVEFHSNELRYKWDGIMGIAIHNLNAETIKKCDISFWRRFTALYYPADKLNNNTRLIGYIRRNKHRIDEAPNLADKWRKYMRITIGQLPTIPRAWEQKIERKLQSTLINYKPYHYQAIENIIFAHAIGALDPNTSRYPELPLEPPSLDFALNWIPKFAAAVNFVQAEILDIEEEHQFFRNKTKKSQTDQISALLSAGSKKLDELSRAVDFSLSTLKRRIGDLIRDNKVVRLEDPTDRRRHRYALASSRVGLAGFTDPEHELAAEAEISEADPFE